MAESYSVTPESVGLKLNRDPLLANLDGRSNVTPVENQSDRLFNDPTIGGGIEYKQEGPSKRFNIEASKEVPLLRSDNLNLDANVRGGAWESTSSQDAFIVNEKGQRIGASVSGNIILNNEGTARLRGRLDKDFTNVGMKSVSPLGNYKGQDGNTYTKWDLGLDVGPLGVDFGEKAVTYTLGNNGKFYFNKDSVGVKYERKFNKGGTPMIKKQMEMFEDGGLKDQGGTVDPMSGNDVPVGSTQKEVRDDIPAQLSEGEFVFPADVVRFIGLEKLMGLRQQAKMGLKKMEQMGQMGNSDEATMPDDMPFGMADLIVMSPEGRQVEMAEGGVVQAATGVNVTPSTRGSTTGVTRTNNVTPTSSNFLAPTTRPLVTGTSNTRPRPNVPTFEDSMGQASITLIQYQNTEGATLMVPHMGGKPIYPVPAGYYEVNADGTPVNPEDVPAAGAGDATTQPVKPIEVGDGPDRDIIGMVPGSVGSAASSISATSSMADLMTGKREPTMLEKMYIGSKAQIAVTRAQLKAAGIRSTGNAERDLLAISLYNSTMEGKRSGIVPNSEEDIKNKKDIDDLKTKYVGKNTKLANQQMTTKQPFTAPPKNNTLTDVSTTPTAQQKSNEQMITDQSFTPTAQQLSNQQMATDQGFTPTAQQLSNQQMSTNQIYTPDVTETPSISPEQLDYNIARAIAKYNEQSSDILSDEKRMQKGQIGGLPPKGEDKVVNVLTSEGIQNMYTPSADFTDVDFGEYSPPQASLEQYNVANPTYEGLTTKNGEIMSALGDDIKSYVSAYSANTLMDAEEESRAKAAEEFARVAKIKAASELRAAEQQSDALQAAAEAKAKEDAEKEQAAIDYTVSQPDGGTSYTAPSTPSGGSAGYSGSYNEPGRGDGPDGPDAPDAPDAPDPGSSYGGGPFNKGGLAAKKTKKKPTKRYKKGGLAASKK